MDADNTIPVKKENRAIKCESFVLQHSWNVRSEGGGGGIRITGLEEEDGNLGCVGVVPPFE